MSKSILDKDIRTWMRLFVRRHIQKLWIFVQKLIEPHPNINDPEDRYRSRLLNTLMVLYIPMAALVIIFRIFVLPGDITSTIVIVLCGIPVVGIIYGVGRMGRYRMSIYAAVILGYGIIYFNAVNSSPPHFEIAYLIVLPLLGIVLFSLQEAFINNIIAILLLLLFIVTTNDMEQGVAVDLFVFIMLTEGFIFFANYQRNRLDENRRALAVEREQSKLTKQLIDNVSHDFKTPLSIIQTSIYLIRKVDTPEKREQGLNRIEQQAFRLESMIQDLLTMSSLDQTHLPDFSTIDLEQLITTAQLQLSSLADAKQITLEQCIHTDKPVVYGYLDELTRMTLNLIENAITYTPEGGQIRITLSAVDSDNICLEIADTGIGIEDKDLAHIFDRFYRADKARSTRTGGSGLGLAIVRRIVERHRGAITVKSKVNVGTTVSVVLPKSPKK